MSFSNIFIHGFYGRPLMVTLAALLVFAACDKQSGNESTDCEDDQMSISFAGSPLQTKAGGGDVITNTDDKLKKAPFGIFGFKTSSDDSSITGNLNNVFSTTDAQEVGWDTDEGKWTYSPKRRWENSMHYRFRAFWPYDVELNPDSNASRIGIEYKATTESYDLLVAYATRYPLNEGIQPVRLVFHHALSGLRFKIRFDSKVKKGTVDYVNRFYLQGMYSVGYMIYGQMADSDPVDKIEWIFDRYGNTFDKTSRMFDWTGKEKFSIAANATDKSEVATVFDNDKVVFIPPQTLSSSLGVTTANFYTQTGGDALHSVDIPRTTLEPGKIYTFTLVIHDTYLTVDIDIKDWDVLQSNVDINL